MKFLVLGSVKGDFDLINRYIEKSGADAVLSTGNLGLFYRNERFSNLPKLFRESNFFEYLEGKKEFAKPVYTVRGAHDNLGLCSQLIKNFIHVKNFHLIEDGKTVSIKNNTQDNLPIPDIIVGGIGGSYSPKYYPQDKLVGNAKRHFSHKHVEEINRTKTHILLLHDLIGNCSKKSIMFSDETLRLLQSSSPLYCFGGKYHWWAHAKVSNSNFVLLPYADDGYLILDTNKDWNAEGIRFDLRISN